MPSSTKTRHETISHPGILNLDGSVSTIDLLALSDYYRVHYRGSWSEGAVSRRAIIGTGNYGYPKTPRAEVRDRLISLSRHGACSSRRTGIGSTVRPRQGYAIRRGKRALSHERDHGMLYIPQDLRALRTGASSRSFAPPEWRGPGEPHAGVPCARLRWCHRAHRRDLIQTGLSSLPGGKLVHPKRDARDNRVRADCMNHAGRVMGGTRGFTDARSDETIIWFGLLTTV